MPLDPSIILDAKPPAPINPLQIAGQVAEVQNARNQNALFQAKALAGQYQQQAVDPVTGQTDPNKLNNLLMGDPRTAPYAMEARQQALGNQAQGISNQTAQTSLAGNYSQNLMGDVARVSAATQGDHTAILSAIQQGVASGRYPADFAANFVGGGPLPNGTTLDMLAKSSVLAAGNGAEQAGEFGTPTQVNTGNTIKNITVNPVTHQVADMGGPDAAIPLTLSPEAAASRVGVVENGTPGTVALGSMGQGFTQSALTPAQNAAGAATGSQQGQDAASLQSAAAGAPSRKAILGEMAGALGDFTPGPGAQRWGGIFSEANRIFPGLKLDTTGVAAQEEFTKLSQQIAQQQFGALGGTGTDAKLNSAMQTNPHDALSKLGNQNIISLLKGNEDALQAKQMAWQKWQDQGHGPETYNQFSTQFNQIYDPRVFQFRYMSPDQQKAALAGMDKGERAKFTKQQKIANQLGWTQ